ncbi:RloB domain-containing protein [Streptomyces bauhiniae]|uniref:RloB domain-containing protein n=1 Tax=Streptomyces bauhiniae TaxID=2340725 RepID=A0A4Z1CZB6_9ACTN|nr:RloB family protein [Streptomyces bauhiniae]TGN74757.1 RloB domain-containing protein [Streptomyces bauhiniae]
MARPFPREGSGRRRGPVRRSARTLLIVCGSKETERQYFQGLREQLRNPAVSVVVRGKACSPTQLVAYAKTQRSLGKDSFDEVWCVFDVDQFPDVSTAVATARRAGIRVAVSHPCFELWLLLHFTAHTAHAATYKALLPILRKHVPEYDKTRIDFAVYRDGRTDAMERARKLDSSGQDYARNPSTGVWQLVERMEER